MVDIIIADIILVQGDGTREPERATRQTRSTGAPIPNDPCFDLLSHYPRSGRRRSSGTQLWPGIDHPGLERNPLQYSTCAIERAIKGAGLEDFSDSDTGFKLLETRAFVQLPR